MSSKSCINCILRENVNFIEISLCKFTGRKIIFYKIKKKWQLLEDKTCSKLLIHLLFKAIAAVTEIGSFNGCYIFQLVSILPMHC